VDVLGEHISNSEFGQRKTGAMGFSSGKVSLIYNQIFVFCRDSLLKHYCVFCQDIEGWKLCGFYSSCTYN